MDLKKLIEKSKIYSDNIAKDFKTIDNSEKLIPINNSNKINVKPIWKYPINNSDEDLYLDYLEHNPKYNQIFVRSSLHKQLKLASGLLPSNYILIIREGHRPYQVQKKLLHKLMLNYLAKNNNSSEEEAIEFARTYVSDPSIILPPHSCGAAVDIDIFDVKTNKLLDFGSPVNTESKISFLHSENITKVQKDNRMMLLEIMLSSNFASTYTEWWHYSYGDTIWAWFYEKPNAIYNLIEPDL